MKELAEHLINECDKKDFNIVIYCTYRSNEEQNELYEKGRTKPGSIVTHVKGGYSFHNYGVAFDCAPLVNGKIEWGNIDLFKAMGKVGERLGLGWGGSLWPNFKDYPHFQYTEGYSIEDFLNNRIDWNKFSVSTINKHDNIINLIKNSSSGKVYAIGRDNKKHWIFNEETFRIGKEMGLWGDIRDEDIRDDNEYTEGHVLIFTQKP